MTGKPILEVQDLHKTFVVGFFRKRIEALRGVTFSVNEGETFGFVGHNGAGKTTTIKAILQLIFPTRGHVRMFGKEGGDARDRVKLGYLPENPYVYQYLKPLEFLDMCGQLVGMNASDRRKRSDELLQRLSLAHAVDRPIGKFSKGMMQRIGVAQALLHDPELLIMDEPFSGLDPVGRKDIRDLFWEQRRRGKTLMFTSHVLSDVELLCDRVAIVRQGQVTACGTMKELLRPDVITVEVELRNVAPELRTAIEATGTVETREAGAGAGLVFVLQGEASLPAVLKLAVDHNARVESVSPHRESLEDLFLRDPKASPTSQPPPTSQPTTTSTGPA